MCGFRRWVAAFGALIALGLSLPARAAWVETRVKAHTATLDIERDGSALVTHELQLGVRGGPLERLEIAGVDADAEPVGEATVTPVVRYGVPAAIPLVVARRDDGTLAIEIQSEKGLRTGSYTFVIRYKTQLLARDKIRRRGGAAEVEWIGPRFPDGIDVAKVVFRLPASDTPPALANEVDSEDAAVLGSAFVSAVRRERGKIELEVVRAHVARGEPAVWRVLASPSCFDGLARDEPAPKAAAAARVLAAERPEERVYWALSALAIALAYGLLVLLKSALFRRDCAATGAELRALVPLPVGLRAALSGALLAFAAVLAVLGDHPTVAAALLLASTAVAALRTPESRPPPRGPGQWLPLTDADAFAGKLPRRASRFLDAGTLPGLAVLLVFLAAAGAGAAWLAPKSAYHALALLLGTACCVPIFGTGRVASLPVDRARAPRAFLMRAARLLRRRPGLKVAAWARIPDGARDPDELRLLVRVAQPLDGFLGIELGLLHQPTAAGVLASPFVIVRVKDGSRSHSALPRRHVWQRGRRVEERVAVLKPPLPLPHAAAVLIEELALQLSDPGDASPTRARKAAGASSLTAKLAAPSPAHAM